MEGSDESIPSPQRENESSEDTDREKRHPERAESIRECNRRGSGERNDVYERSDGTADHREHSAEKERKVRVQFGWHT